MPSPLNAVFLHLYIPLSYTTGLLQRNIKPETISPRRTSTSPSPIPLVLSRLNTQAKNQTTATHKMSPALRIAKPRASHTAGDMGAVSTSLTRGPERPNDSVLALSSDSRTVVDLGHPSLPASYRHSSTIVPLGQGMWGPRSAQTKEDQEETPSPASTTTSTSTLNTDAETNWTCPSLSSSKMSSVVTMPAACKLQLRRARSVERAIQDHGEDGHGYGDGRTKRFILARPLDWQLADPSCPSALTLRLYPVDGMDRACSLVHDLPTCAHSPPPSVSWVSDVSAVSPGPDVRSAWSYALEGIAACLRGSRSDD